jgi:predicted TIM-barrel fold metal-dependent hydrolase
MGVTQTVLLPAGSPVVRPSTHMGESNGLRVGVGTNPTALEFVRRHQGTFWCFANEVPDLPQARDEIERYLKQGAIGIGELKFNLECDSPDIQKIAALADEYRVPVLLHFSREGFNLPVARFYKMLEKFPGVNFIGHARLFWANIDKNCDQTTDYPNTAVTPGGLTDQYLSDYPNMYGDISAGSGLNALLRDEGHARWFLQKHQDKILFGSDCGDRNAHGPECDGANIIAALRRLCPSRAVERKILFDNAKRLLRI